MAETKREWHRIKGTCPVCGQEFVKQYPSRTCSIGCRDALRRAKREKEAPVAVCRICKDIKPLVVTAHGERLCSQRCKNVFYQRVFRGADTSVKVVHHNKKKPVGAKSCEFCDKEFEYADVRARFCSYKCKEAARRVNPRSVARRREAEDARIQRRNNVVPSCAICTTPKEQIRAGCELGLTHGSGKAKFHQDHIQPKGQNGSDDPSNLRWVCWFCNVARLSMDTTFDSAVAAAGRTFWLEVNRIKSDGPAVQLPHDA